MAIRDELWRTEKLALLFDALFRDPKLTTVNPKGVAVGTTSTVVLDANTKRRYVHFMNDSDTAMYLAMGTTAVVNKGIRLNASGDEPFQMDFRNLFTGTINAITSAANKNLCIIEGE